MKWNDVVSSLYRVLQWRVVQKRAPDYVVGSDPLPYLRRWWVIPRNKWFNIYLHEFMRSDDDRALHDHPWVSVSLLLSGSYVEHRILNGGVHTRKRYNAGSTIFRRAKYAHRVEIDGPCWTLFVTGPVVREWGFHCPHGWVSYKDFLDPTNSGLVGRGCSEHETSGRVR